MRTKIHKFFKLAILSLLLMSAGALYSQTATLTIPGQDAAIGPVVVPLTCTEISANPVSGIQFYVNWDPLVLTYTGWSDFFTTEGGPTVNEANVGDGELIIVWSENSPFGNITMTAPFTFMNISFDFAGGYSAVTWGTTTKDGAIGWPEKGITTMASFSPPIFFPNFDLDWPGNPNAGYVQEGGGALDYVWIGAVNEDWDEIGNWEVGGLPATMLPQEVDNVEFPGDKAGPCTIGGSVTVTNILISGGTLNVAPGGDLTSLGTFTNNGFFNINSDGGGLSGSYINTFGQTFDGGGTFTFNRDITTTAPAGVQAGWHYLSSPINTFSTWNIFDYYANYWTEATGAFTQVLGNPAIPCDPGPNVAIGAYGAWSVKWDNAYSCGGTNPATGTVIPLSGAPGAVNSTALATGALSRTALSPYAGWHLLGNPYPCAIDFELVDLSNFGGVVRIYNDNIGNYESWVTGAGFNLAPTQGFFIEAQSDGVTLDVSPGRTHDAAAQFKSSYDRLTLQATGAATAYLDRTHIRIMDNATTGVDTHVDATKWMSTVPQAPQMYTHAEGENMEWNSLPEVPAFVHMSFEVGTAGTYTIEAIETGSFSHVVLEDGLTGEQTNLLEESYTFDYTNAGEVHPFVVHFTPLGTPELEANSIRIWGANQTINVVVPEAATGTIAVYNMMGQEVISKDVDPGMNILPVRDVNTYYIVKVLTENNAKTGKVFIK